MCDYFINTVKRLADKEFESVPGTGDTAGVGTASIHQDASRQQLSTAQTAGSTPRRRRRIDLHSLGMQNQRARRKDILQGVDARTPLMCNVL